MMMKNVLNYLKALVVVAFAALSVVSCEKSDDGDDDPVTYAGTMTITSQADGTSFSNPSVEMELDITGSTIDLIMYGVKFAEAMPVTMDLVITDLTQISGSSLEVSAPVVTNLSGDVISYVPIIDVSVDLIAGILSVTFTCNYSDVLYSVSFYGM